MAPRDRGGPSTPPPVNEAPFPIHDASIEVPQRFDVKAAESERLLSIGTWLSYITTLQAKLKTAEGISDEERKYYEITYSSELQKYYSYTGEGTAHTGVPPSGASSSVRAKLPEKFTGAYEKLDLFLSNMIAYFDVVSTPLDKRAGVLRLNLSDSVVQTLTQTNRSNPSFWESLDNITQALMEFYSQPNKKTAAQTRLKSLKMHGFKLSKYFNTFVTLCGESGYNPDDQHHKSAFHLGLNNDATGYAYKCSH